MENYNVMEKATLQAEDLLEKYYGIESGEPCPKSACDGNHGEPVVPLKESYERYLGNCENDGIILQTLYSLYRHFRQHRPMADEEAFQNAIRKNIRRDLLRLYVFCHNSSKNYENINLSSRVDSIRLSNSSNWLWNELMKNYLRENLPDITSVAQAKDELMRGKSKRGRQPKDARIPVIIWGTYRLLTDLHGFRTPMPNSLCDFLVRLLQDMGIIPENTEIDKYWIRAELRYIKGRKSAER